MAAGMGERGECESGVSVKSVNCDNRLKWESLPGVGEGGAGTSAESV